MQGVFSQHLFRSMTPPLPEPPPPPLSLWTWLTPFNLDTLSCCYRCSTINPVVLALLKCLTFGILLGSVVEEGDFSQLRERRVRLWGCHDSNPGGTVSMKHSPLPKSCSSCTNTTLLCHHGLLATWGHKGLLKSTTKIQVGFHSRSMATLPAATICCRSACSCKHSTRRHPRQTFLSIEV
jgi:hypothetical protein